MQNKSACDRSTIIKELEEIREKEESVDDELRRYVLELVGQRANQAKGVAHETVNLTHSVDKIMEFDPCFEAMIQDSRKLAYQIGDCRGLSDRLSSLVRRLDTIQIRAQQALACTEDVINLKSCRHGIEAALEENDLQAAVNFVKLVHDIDPEVAKSSDDYAPVLQAERETKTLVHDEFKRAVESSDIQTVISLCPTLQTLGLENEARDSFLEFVDKNVFNALSADACAVDGATEPATGYAQALSNIFNAAFAIIQQYLPVVIEGMENSNGDIYFIRKLHGVCTKEAGIILKRYMKYRKMKDLLTTIKGGASSKGGGPSFADVHGILDEFTLLLQYCCSYASYMHDLCRNAESPRKQCSKTNGNKSPAADASVTSSQQRIVFDVGHENGFDKMVEELVSVYYLDCEKWLIHSGLQSVILTQSKSVAPKASGMGGESGGNSQSVEDDDGASANGGLDEFFFVLQRCGMRAIGSSSLHASSAVLHLITDCLTGDVIRLINSRLNGAVAKITAILTDIISKWSKKDDSISAGTFSSGIKSAFFSSISSSSAGASSSGGNTEHSSGSGLDALLLSAGEALDPFTTCSVCIRYIDRLTAQIIAASASVFPDSTPSAASRSSSGSHHLSSEPKSKLTLCKEDFKAVQIAYGKALQSAAGQISVSFESALLALMSSLLGKQGPQGGVKWNLSDDAFDAQPAVELLPKSIIDPVDILVSLCTFGTSDAAKDTIIQLVIDTTAHRFEQYILQTTFSFAGALKFEECVRALISLFTRSASSATVRAKFSRIREIMAVLTTDSRNAESLLDGLATLTNEDVNTFLDLRIDFVDSQK